MHGRITNEKYTAGGSSRRFDGPTTAAAGTSEASS